MASERAIKMWLLCAAAALAVSTGATDGAKAQTRATVPSPGSDSPNGNPDDVSYQPRSVVDPTLQVLQRVIRRNPSPTGLFAPRGAFDADRVDVSLRFDARVDERTLAELERLDVQLQGQAFASDGLYRASMPWERLASVSKIQGLVRIEALWQVRLSQPLEQTNRLISAESARLRPPTTVQGAGVRVGLIDTGVDVLHPALFRADAGYYTWLDVDGDGQFTAGVDAVDLDADGEAGSNESLRVLDATVIVDFEGGEVRNADGQLDTRRDWVYADMNRDGSRNAGAGAGFSESTPAYGEAVFVADDADRSGTLDVGEKLVRLGTSKIARYQTEDSTYTRGNNLIDAAAESVDAFHGTGVSGILVGGQSPFHDRVGVAPSAELFVYGLSATLQRDNRLPLRFLEEAVEDEVDLLLHEWTNSFTQPMDGSTNFEAAMNSARDAGIVQVTPVGNLNESQKHRIADADAGSPTALTFVVDEGFSRQGQSLPYEAAFGSLQWTESHPSLVLEFTSPSGETHLWRMDGSASVEIDGARLDLAYAETARGSGYVEFYLEAASQDATLGQGEWTFELRGFSGPDQVWARVTDEYSNWRPGIRWKQPTVDRGTVAFPATADSAFGVGAYVGRSSVGTTDGEDHRLRGFSGRGPRLDGRAAVALTAPDDPFVPLAATPEILDAGWGRTWFTAFAGTSGAAPHVAGTIALMKSESDQLTPAQIEERLIQAARSDDLAPEPEQLPGPGWGHGRLDAYAAIFEEPAPALGERPSAVLELVPVASGVRMDAAASEPGDALQYRFDLEYDGVWDGGWTDEPTVVVGEEITGGGEFWGRVEVRNGIGRRHGAVAHWNAAGGDAGGDGDTGSPDAGADAGGGSPDPKGCCSQSATRSVPTSGAWLLLFATAFLSRRWQQRRGA